MRARSGMIWSRGLCLGLGIRYLDCAGSFGIGENGLGVGVGVGLGWFGRRGVSGGSASERRS